MKRILLILLVFTSLTSFSQIRVKEDTFRKTKKIKEVKDERLYHSYDRDYALIKISMENVHDFLKPTFEFSTFDRLDIDKEINKKTIDISLDENTESIHISHPLYGNIEYAFPEKLQTCGIYEMVMVSDEDVVDTLKNAVEITSYPLKSSVFLDEEYVGKTPLTLRNLFTGKYDLRIEKKGYLVKDTTFFIAANDTLSFVVDTLKRIDDFAYQNFELGKKYYDGDSVTPKDYVKAIEYFQTAADYGYIEANFYLAECYYNGTGVEQDYDAAMPLYTLVANKGMSDAQMVLAYSYYNGIGVMEDKSVAVKWYKKAANQDVAIAQNILGYCYHDGVGVKQNKSTAMKWYAKSAELGNADAQNTMGLFYYNSPDVENNYALAVDLFVKSVAQGNKEAQYNLGNCYALSRL